MADVDDELWDEFHRVVNMTSRELADWLRTRDAGEHAEELPDQAGTPTGREVLAILGKRRRDLTDEDARVMGRVVERVHAQRQEELEPTAGQAAWRRRLMSLGHDPLKPA
jgi:uroporphyrinogen-III synthase